jgi:hypothetical protein
MGGRLFYSGINSKVVGKDISPKLSGAVLFSQIAKSDADLVKCYQEADPTSPNSNELVDTDGGIIFITEASNIVKIQNTQGSVLVFAENGVWEIRGDEGGFRATSFQVNKISNIGVIARESIVDANGTIYFWGRDGIYTMTPNQLGTGYDTVNITLNTIQSAFNTMPDFARRGVKAYYDVSANSIRWLFNLVSENVIDIPAPTPPAYGVGTLTDLTADNRRFPEFAKVSANTGVIVYTDVSLSTVYAKAFSIDPDTLVVTTGTEVTVGTSNITGNGVTQLSDGKVLAVWTYNSGGGITTAARVLNVSGVTITAATAYDIDTGGIFRPTPTTSRLRVDSISSGTAVVVGQSNTNGNPAGQVLNIDASDVITFGSVAKDTGVTNFTEDYGVALINSTTGFAIAHNTVNSTVMRFSISGTTFTWSAVRQAFLNTTQFPGATFTGGANSSIKRTTDASAIVRLSANHPYTGTPIPQFIFNVVDEGASIGFIANPIIDDTFTWPSSDGNTEYAFDINAANKPTSVFVEDADSDSVYALRMITYPNKNNPLTSVHTELIPEASGALYDNTSTTGGYVSDYVMAVVIRDNDDGNILKIIGVRNP